MEQEVFYFYLFIQMTMSNSMAISNSKPPFLLKYRSSRLFIELTICTAIFCDLFLYGMIVPVMPYALVERANTDPKDTQKWTSLLLSVYGAALLATSPFVGWIVDHTKTRRLPLLVGLAALAASTVLLWLSRSLALLIVARAFQGASGSVVWTTGLALMIDTVEKDQIGQAMGYTALANTLAVLCSPLLAGVVYEHGGYSAVFYMAFGIIAIDVIMRLVMIERKVAMKWLPEAQIPLQRVSEDEQCSQTILQGDREAQQEEQQEDRLQLQQEQRQVTSRGPASKIPPVITLLKSRRILTALYGILINSIILTSFESTLPYFVKDTFGWSSAGAGLIFLAPAIPNVLSPLVGWASDKYGARIITTLGFFLALVPLVLLRLVTYDSIRQIVLLCALLVLVGCSLTLSIAPLMAELTHVVNAKEEKCPGIFGSRGAYGQVYALLNTFWAAGTLIGPLWGNFIEQAGGWSTFTWTLGLLSVVSALPIFIYMGGNVFRRKN